jgi:hypothetical protein
MNSAEYRSQCLDRLRRYDEKMWESAAAWINKDFALEHRLKCDAMLISEEVIENPDKY